MTNKLPLWSQPGSFWIGAGLIAGLPYDVIALFLSAQTKEAIMNFIFSGPIGIVTALAVVVGSLLLTGWIGHRAGLGL
jgi:hypothetical protein